ncbi:MAG TPA: ribonuclease H-like domain-containing protein [Patescibacteria group bacterium]|nr:ribonuclease H-like domain-containing protein [Patescibacteria group bacterium]
MKHVFFDVETKNTFDEVGGYFPTKLSPSFIGVCVREGFEGPGEMIKIWESDFQKLWGIFETADVIVGFNSVGFDMEVMRPLYPGKVDDLPQLDLMLRFKEATGHRISLDSIAQETLGKAKIGHGLDAIKYYKEGRLDELAKYCLMDVEITRDLYDWGRTKGKVKFKNKWNRLIETPIDFSFKPKKVSGTQMTLLGI